MTQNMGNDHEEKAEFLPKYNSALPVSTFVSNDINSKEPYAPTTTPAKKKDPELSVKSILVQVLDPLLPTFINKLSRSDASSFFRFYDRC